MTNPPSGVVTFLFTDIEGSTRLAQAHPDRWESLREKHHAMLKEAIESKRGHILQIIGDAFCVAFHTAGDAARAEETVQEAMKVLHEVGEMSAEIGALDVAGRVALAQGDLPKAQKHFREGISRLKDSKEVSQLPSLLEGLANALAQSSQTQHAILLLGAAQALRGRIHLTRMQFETAEYDALLSAQREEAGGDFQSMWEDGCALSTEQAIELALS
ncbi:MAG: hypothetical protein HFACDABA_00774 [Anaerolineales bacterium]|nr:hypothetical protein [Anaerolineales bacterium]